MHRWSTLVLLFLLAAAAAVLWPTPVFAAPAEAGAAAHPPGPAAVAAVEPAAAAPVRRAAVAVEPTLLPEAAALLVGPAETTRRLGTLLRSVGAPHAEVTCRDEVSALRDVVAGRADAALLASPFEHLFAAEGLRELALGDFVVVLVRHRANPLPGISRVQLDELSRGRVRSWADLGGEPRELHVLSTFTGPEAEGRALGLPRGLARVRARGLGAAEVLARVARDPGALGVVALASVPETLPVLAIGGVLPSDRAFASGGYPFGYRLRLVHRAEPRAPLSDVRAFLCGRAARAALEP